MTNENHSFDFASFEKEHISLSKRIGCVLTVSYLARSGEKVNFRSTRVTQLSQEPNFYLDVANDIDKLILKIDKNISHQSFFKKRKLTKAKESLLEAKEEVLNAKRKA